MVFYFQMYKQTDTSLAGSKHLVAIPIHKDFSAITHVSFVS
jgi:hypothetical protein